MKSKPVICAIFCIASIASIASKIEAVETLKGWREWMSEGDALRAAGKYPAAIAALRQALAAAVSQETDSHLIQTLSSLAAAYVETGQVSEAEHQYQRALAAAEALQGRKSLSYAVLLASLASISAPIGNNEETIATLREAIVVYRRIGSAQSLATVRECLAQILIEKKAYPEAETLLLDARADLANQKTADPVLLCTAVNNLGQLRYQQGRFEEALALYVESNKMLKAALGDEHPTMVLALNNLALSYFQMGRLDDADKTFQQAVAVCNRALGDHPTCAGVFDNYAVVLRKLKRKGEAKKLEARSQRISEASGRRNGSGMTISVSALRSDKN